MISFESAQNLLSVTVVGEFTLEEFKQVEEHLNFKLRFEGGLDMLLDLRLMTGSTLDAAWAELKYSKHHPHEFGKIAVVSNDQWVAWTAWLSNIFVEAEMKMFDEIDDALAWLDDCLVV